MQDVRAYFTVWQPFLETHVLGRHVLQMKYDCTSQVTPTELLNVLNVKLGKFTKFLFHDCHDGVLAKTLRC